MGFFPKHWTEYPPEYNREIHGPYNPSVYYGKRDTPLSEVKLGDLLAWIGRRRKTPSAMAQAFGRAWFRYQMNWIQVKKPGAIFLYQMIAASVIVNYYLCYNRFKAERIYRYH